MLAAILQMKLCELGANVEKILYAKKSRRNTENKTLVSGHLEYSGHIGGHLENES